MHLLLLVTVYRLVIGEASPFLAAKINIATKRLYQDLTGNLTGCGVGGLGVFFSPMNGAHETLLENKAQKITQTSPETSLSGKLCWCLDSAIWVPSRAGRWLRRWVRWLSELLEDCLDLTWSPDGRGDIGPQITFQARKDENQELPASEASTPSIAIGVTGYGEEPAGEHSWSPRLGSMFIRISFSLPISRGHR